MQAGSLVSVTAAALACGQAYADETPPRAQPTAQPAARPAGPAPAPRAAIPEQPAPRPRKVIVEPPAPVPDPRAQEQARESNLEDNGPRRGLVVGLSAVGWQQVGTIDGASAAGGAVLRLGAVATPRTVVMLELFGLAFPQGSGDSYIAASQALTLVALTYVAPTLWVRGGAGLAGFLRAIEDKANPDTYYNAHFYGGLGMTFGAGLDLVSWRRTRLQLENTVALHRFSQGWIVDLGVGIGVTVY